MPIVPYNCQASVAAFRGIPAAEEARIKDFLAKKSGFHEAPVPSETMSFLFDRRTKKIIRWVWGVIAIVVAIGMVFFFAPGLPEWLAGLF